LNPIKLGRDDHDHAAELAAADPAMPEGVVNRAADNWRPLLSITDLADSPRISTVLGLISKRHKGTGVTFPNWPKPQAFLGLVTM
jgi:hypothetical protein